VILISLYKLVIIIYKLFLLACLSVSIKSRNSMLRIAKKLGNNDNKKKYNKRNKIQ